MLSIPIKKLVLETLDRIDLLVKQIVNANNEILALADEIKDAARRANKSVLYSYICELKQEVAARLDRYVAIIAKLKSVAEFMLQDVEGEGESQ